MIFLMVVLIDGIVLWVEFLLWVGRLFRVVKYFMEEWYTLSGLIETGAIVESEGASVRNTFADVW